MRLVAGLALAGLRRQSLRWLVLALGIAVASAFPVLAGGLRAGAQAAAIRAAVDDVPENERAVVALSSRTSLSTDAPALDSAVRQKLTAAGLPDVTHSMAFRTLSVSGTEFSLAALDGLPAATRLTSGTLPASCQPQRCEVLLTSAGGDQQTDTAVFAAAAGELGLVVTGTAELLDDRMVGAGMIDADQPLLLGGDVDALNLLDKLSLFGRTFGWIGPLNGGRIATIGADAFGAALSSLTDQLNLTFGTVTVRWPSDLVSAAVERAATSAHRLTVLGATGAALQLGFCLAAAVGLRTRQRLVGRLLDRRGASPSQVTAVPLVQAALAMTTGVVVGSAVGFLVTALTAGDGPPGGWAVAADALSTGWTTVLAVAALAVLLAVLVVRWPADAGLVTRVVLDTVFVLALGVTALAVARSGAAGSADDPLTTSVLILVALATGLATARAWPLVAGAVRRLLGRRPRLPSLLAVIGGQRRLLRPAVTAGFLAAAICSVVFAGAYRITLQESAADQAAFTVPQDVAIGTSRFVANPLLVVDAGRIGAAGGTLSTITSTAVGVASGTPGAVSLPLLGVDPQVLLAMQRFENTTGSAVPATTLAAQLVAGAPPTAGHPPIPAGHHRLSVPVGGMRPDIVLSLWLATDDGLQSQVELADPNDPAAGGTGDPSSGNGSAARDVELSAIVDLERPAHLAAVEVAEAEWHRTARLHGIGEGPVDQALPTGDLAISALAVDGVDLGQSWTGWGSDQVQAGTPDAAGALPVHFQINDTRAVLTADFVAKSQLEPLPVATDPATAALARNDLLTVTIGGVSFPASLAQVLPRMPTQAARFLLADQQGIAALVNRVAPGTDPITQVWIQAPGNTLPAVRAALAGPPASTATVAYRADLQSQLSADPVATRTADLLVLAALLAMVLAAVALAMAVLADRAEEADDLLVWEVDGLPPSTLRSVLFRRSVLVAAAGVPLGVIGGVLLTQVAVRLISVGAAGTDPQPPLHPVFGWGWTTLVVATALAVSLAAAAVAAVTSLRDRLPQMSDADLR